MTISAHDCFAVWAPDNVFWSQWAKPVVFASASMLSDEPEPALPVLDYPGLPRTFDPAAIVVDLPGAQAVLVGLALAERGYRPVPLFNGTSGPNPVVEVDAIERALGAGAAVLRRLTLAQEARPAFLLDADRGSVIGAAEPGRYDNRWIVLPQDVPSGTALLARGIKEIMVIQARATTPDQDLTYVLLRWQEAGLKIRALGLETGEVNEALSLAAPSRMRRLWYGAIALMGLRRSNAGGFGSLVPEETRSTGFYG